MVMMDGKHAVSNIQEWIKHGERADSITHEWIRARRQHQSGVDCQRHPESRDHA